MLDYLICSLARSLDSPNKYLLLLFLLLTKCLHQSAMSAMYI